MTTLHQRCGWLCTTFATFVVAVALNYLWEAGQAFLYVGMVSFQTIWWHCFVAALGDGIILLLIHLVGWLVFRQADWFAQAGHVRIGLMLASGLGIAVAIEWIAVHWLQRWAYTAEMPMLPGLGVGLTPVLQMLMLPPLVFWIVATWCHLGRTSATP